MIFIKIADNNEILEINNFPFDEVHGLGKTEDELLKEGILVQSIPEPDVIANKAPVLKYDGSNLYYEYVEIPLTKEQQMEQDLKTIKAQNAQMLFALVEGGLL